MPEILTSVEDLSPERLTAILQENGYLLQGQVSAVTVLASHSTKISTTAHLGVRYAGEADDLPTKFLLKICGKNAELGAHEVAFYQVIVPHMAETFAAQTAPFLHCFAAAYDATSDRAYLILEDLTDTHFSYEQQAPKALHYELVIEALARMHAFWWNHPELEKVAGERMSAGDITDAIDLAKKKAYEFIDFMGNRLERDQREALMHAASVWPKRRRADMIDGRNLTLIHRDPHPLNFLHPYDLETGYAKIIDWQSWRVDNGAFDLAYIMGVNWHEPQRKQLEKSFLRFYLEILTEEGVENYQWDDLWYDYQAGMARSVFVLISLWSQSVWDQGWWWPKLRSALDAYNSLKCDALP